MIKINLAILTFTILLMSCEKPSIEQTIQETRWLISDSISAAPFKQKQYFVDKGDSAEQVNIRSKSSSKSSIVKTIPRGTPLTTVQFVKDPDWIKVEGDGFSGYLGKKFLDSNHLQAKILNLSIQNNQAKLELRNEMGVLGYGDPDATIACSTLVQSNQFTLTCPDSVRMIFQSAEDQPITLSYKGSSHNLEPIGYWKASKLWFNALFEFVLAVIVGYLIIVLGGYFARYVLVPLGGALSGWGAGNQANARLDMSLNGSNFARSSSEHHGFLLKIGGLLLVVVSYLWYWAAVLLTLPLYPFLKPKTN